MALLNSRKASELIRNQTGRSCTRQNLEKLCRAERLPTSCKSLAPIRLDDETLVEEYLSVVDPRQAEAVNRGPATYREEVAMAEGGPLTPKVLKALAMDATRRLDPDDLREPAESRRMQQHYEAELARLKSDQLDGTVVLAAEAEAAMFARARSARDALQGITPRVIEELCSIAGSLDAEQRHRAQVMLDRELLRVCEALAQPVLRKEQSDAG